MLFKDFTDKHSLLIFFVLAFIVSWGFILIMAGPDEIPVNASDAGMLGAAMLLGPFISSVLLTGILSGKAGFREILSRLSNWKISARWYVIAVITAPLTSVIVLLALSSQNYLPAIFTIEGKANLVFLGITAGIMVGFFEELGWTGFAVPRLRKKSGIFSTGIIAGVLWGLWHFILFWETDSFSATLPFVLLLARILSWLPAYRILMVWVHDHTQSLLVTMLMHVSKSPARRTNKEET
ncbi:MAG: CPBP family intramembrane metalloprotease [Spirochaetes bacterium]|nr:CPBP family intramembrane metalloprotease [Spirochaetota bacterium]